ncbi:hypothetical protein QN277_015201 [Acacia crassicarpa]|uniref:GRF-type domain-containing protein n=1 Tax=Acacia crassicarpa TaxID=499986 RepID=A0AAE1KLP8_9FABA|nr:hypothetical protein QN277_015201 [Acacia crassicarpa]
MEQRRGMSESTTSATSTRRRRTTMQPCVRGDVREPRASTMCYCGVVARLYTSWTAQNPGRRFFGCRNYQPGRGYGFFKWHDEEMGRRAKEVINELLGQMENVNDENVGLTRMRMDEGGFAGYIEDDIATIYANMKKNERKLKQAFCALFVTWLLCIVLLLR